MKLWIAFVITVFLIPIPTFALDRGTPNQVKLRPEAIQSVPVNSAASSHALNHNDAMDEVYLERYLLAVITLILLLSLTYTLYRFRTSKLALRTRENRMRHALEGTNSGLWDWNVEEDRLYLCERFEAMLGYDPGEIGSSLIGLKAFVHPDDYYDVRKRLLEHLKGISPIFESEHRFKHKCGNWLWMSSRGKVVHRDINNSATRIVGTLTDITERKKAEEQLHQNALVFETISEAIIICDKDNNIVSTNQAFTHTTGYTNEEVIGKNPRILKSDKHDSVFYQMMWDSIINTGVWQGEIWNKKKNGDIFPVWLSIATIKGSEGDIDQYIGVFNDITKRKEDEDLIRYQANFDALTELPNRHLLMDRLGFELQRAKREGTFVGLMFIDLDRFKPINDTYGHSVGDQLLWEVAKRLTSHVRETDMVARLGGDEFTVVIPNIDNISEIEQTVTRILSGIAAPFDLDGHELFISASIGITVYPDDATDISTLMTNADNAMYRAKEEGKNTFCFFTREMNKHAKEMLKIENDLHHVIQKKELIPYFHPILDIHTGEVTAVEVLLRWKRPGHGIIAAESFIPITEATGLIVDIGKWLLEVVCCQVMLWRNIGINIPRICVNISARQFRDNLLDIIKNALETSGLEPEYLELEILESVLLEENKRNADILMQLNEMGIRLSIDDFGTGYSSLSHLKKYPFNALKINRSFICGLPNDKDDVTLVNSIISMSHELGLEVIAEGVETKEQHQHLRTQGCDMAQGFYFTKPIPANKFEKWIKKINSQLSQTL